MNERDTGEQAKKKKNLKKKIEKKKVKKFSKVKIFSEVKICNINKPICSYKQGRKKRQPKNIAVKLLYNKFRNRVNRELKKSKIEYYSQYFEDNSNNSKQGRKGTSESCGVFIWERAR